MRLYDLRYTVRHRFKERNVAFRPVGGGGKTTRWFPKSTRESCFRPHSQVTSNGNPMIGNTSNALIDRRGLAWACPVSLLSRACHSAKTTLGHPGELGIRPPPPECPGQPPVNWGPTAPGQKGPCKKCWRSQCNRFNQGEREPQVKGPRGIEDIDVHTHTHTRHRGTIRIWRRTHVHTLFALTVT